MAFTRHTDEHSGTHTGVSRRDWLLHTIHRLEHVLPGQAPIRDFVHHNTLHGFQHLPFHEAMREARKIIGISGYLPQKKFRVFLHNGRITLSELSDVLTATASLNGDDPVGPVTRGDVYRVVLLTDLIPLTAAQLRWQLEEMNACSAFQPTVGQDIRRRLLDKCAGQSESMVLQDLWRTCLDMLGIGTFTDHVEDVLDLTPEQALQLLSRLHKTGDSQEERKTVYKIQSSAELILHKLLSRIGHDLTLRGMLQTLTGEDVLEQHRAYLIRHLASFLDQGLSPWPFSDRQRGFYTVWREGACTDIAPLLEGLTDWRSLIQDLPDTAVEAIEKMLVKLDLPEELWTGYLEQLALELPGWSGMVMWRNLRPGYQGLIPEQVEMTDYLAVRLVLERIFAHRLCNKEWGLEPRLEHIRRYFEQAQAELLGRWMLFNSTLPDYLSSRIHQLLKRWSSAVVGQGDEWWAIAPQIIAWQFSTIGDYSAHHHGWPLFLLTQHLGISAQELRSGGSHFARELLDTANHIDADTAGHIWLQAYERHYHNQIFGAIVANHGRGRWAGRLTQPTAQLVFCMDDREEGFRRHLEECNPTIETLGTAGFFGVPINWQGLDDSCKTPLCPIVITPTNDVKEEPRPDQRRLYMRHKRRRSFRLRLKNLFFRRSHRGLLGVALLTTLAVPGALVVLAGKLFAPLIVGRVSELLRRAIDITVPTTLTLSASGKTSLATPALPHVGFTDIEQCNRVEGLLRTIGLTSGFSPLVAIVGHGSISQNNPHLAAYDCGACSGRHGGPNARVFAAMANRPEVRQLLCQRGIQISDDCRFLGAEHNTASEEIIWFDIDQLPSAFAQTFAELQSDLAQVCALSAQERSRRLASAPRRPTPRQALAHVIGRTMDFSQARPELGHVTNAVAVIGRRSVTQGAFFDRRMYLVSYDPTQDTDGRIVEGILLAAGPVGAGICLEYYFSTVNNERFGCGTKVTHNLTGFLGVMEGTASDLRTGLPRQMIEIHEAMRLLVIVEQRPDVLAAIYERQPIIRELVGNAWIHLAAKDPDSGTLHIFRVDVGWIVWKPDSSVLPLPQVECSSSWYMGHQGPLPPALVRQPGEMLL